jgi:hypothetical protein
MTEEKDMNGLGAPDKIIDMGDLYGNPIEDSTKNQKHKQQDMTELNADGNRERGREGEDLSEEEFELSDEEEEMLKKKLEQIRKADPFIYR